MRPLVSTLLLAAAPAEAPEPPTRTPAIAPTTATVTTAEVGASSAIDRSRYQIGDGLTLASRDGRFSLQIRGRIQIRYDLEHERGGDTRHALQIRRARVVLMGSVFSPHVKYTIQLGFSPLDMQNDLPSEPGSIRRNPLRDARIELDRLRDFNVWIGQTKVPYSRQRVNASAYMSMVDRSIVNAEFNLDRDIGVLALSKDLGGLDGRLAYYAGVFMGEGRNTFAPADFGLLYFARLEVLPFGAFDDYTEGDLQRSKRPGLSLGGSYAFHDRARAARGTVGDYPADRGTTDFHHLTADLLFKWRGASLATAVHLRSGFNRRSGGAVDDQGAPIPTELARSGLGWYAQLGYLVPRVPLEPVVRVGLLRNIDGDASSLPDASEAGGGLNWYIVGHDLKVQLDYFRLRGEPTAVGPGRADRVSDRVRLQLQLFF